MFKLLDTQGTLLKTIVNDYLLTWLEAFMIDRKAQGVSEGTLHFYNVKFKSFLKFCETQLITSVLQITPIVIRKYILWLEAAGHNPGGRHAHYRAIRSFFYWYENEIEPEVWKNPIKKVKAPLKPDIPLEPVSIVSTNSNPIAPKLQQKINQVPVYVISSGSFFLCLVYRVHFINHPGVYAFC